MTTRNTDEPNGNGRRSIDINTWLKVGGAIIGAVIYYFVSQASIQGQINQLRDDLKGQLGTIATKQAVLEKSYEFQGEILLQHQQSILELQKKK